MEFEVESLRKMFLENVPEGYTKKEIQKMSDEEILDMNYFMNEDDPFEDLFDLEPSDETVLFICTTCKCEENIPKNIVDMLEKEDHGNQDYPPRFTCEKCNNLMYPKNYTSSSGKKYLYPFM